ncbi:MAG: hypothetical protein P1P84_08245 [Deferrisomatales bacterium]|nr:hypothetical protein [Deferrisomatales bacterium]
MRRMRIYLGLALILSVWLAGCGSGPEGAGNRLTVVSITPVEDANEGFVFYGVEETDDVGCDGVAGPPKDPDGTEQNGFWDGPGCFESKTELADDLVEITLRNERRPGVEADPAGGRPLLVTGVRITYIDPDDGTTPAYAPQRLSVQVEGDREIADNGTGTLRLTIVTKEMKAGDGATPGIRDLFFTGAVASELFLDAIVDVFARDTLNNESFNIQYVVPLSFINPNI